MDSDMIFSTVRFAADIIWHPEIAGGLSPHILADIFSECLVDRRAIIGRAEQASLIGIALALVLGIQLSVEPERDDLEELRERVIEHTDLGPSSEARFELIASVLDFVAQTPVPMPSGGNLGVSTHAPPEGLSGTFKVWFARVILQTMWRWRRVQDPMTIIDFYWAAAKCGPLGTTAQFLPCSKPFGSSSWSLAWGLHWSYAIYTLPTTSEHLIYFDVAHDLTGQQPFLIRGSRRSPWSSGSSHQGGTHPNRHRQLDALHLE